MGIFIDATVAETVFDFGCFVASSGNLNISV